MGNNRKILTALAAGVAIGVVAGMHLAGKKKAGDPEDSTNDAGDITEMLGKQFRKGKEKLDSIGQAIIDILTEPREKFE